MPTVDAANERAASSSRPGGAPPAAWADFQGQLMSRPGYPAPISLLGEDGRLAPRAVSCLELAAEYEMVLCTGHVGRVEVFALVAKALELGVDRIVVTHPEFPSIRLSAGEQVELARQGAFIEHCYTTPYTGKVAWETVFENIRAVGPERCVVSSDLGQVGNPPVSAGLADFAQRLLGAGVDPAAIVQMAVANPAHLLRPRQA